jgi:hypothetical protein
MIPENDDELATEVRLARWDKLQPADGRWDNLTGESADRDEVITQLRDLADFLEERPEIPAPPSYTTKYYNVFAAGTDQEMYAQVDYLSTLLGTPVTDNLADGGHYSVSVPFGGLTYQFVAIAKEPAERAPASYAAGQEVQIVPEVADAFRRARIAQAGVILSAEPDDQYLIRLPGQKTIQLPGTVLQPAEPVTVDTLSGTASSLSEIETRLVDAMARTRISQSRDQVPDSRDIAGIHALTFELARICRIPRSTLLRQLEPAITARTEQYQLTANGGQQKTRPASVAAKDMTSRGGEHQPGTTIPAADRTRKTSLSPRHRR